MKLKDAEGWAKGRANNSDDYGKCIYDYAEAWADAIEAAITQGNKLEDVAAALGHAVDERFGITGYMYGCAVSLLSKVWEHGEALRRWHNVETQIGDEGARANQSGGVLNPALLRVQH